MKAAKIREMTADELERAISEHRREGLNLRIQAQTGQLENSARIRTARRTVAQLLTEQVQRSQQPQHQE